VAPASVRLPPIPVLQQSYGRGDRLARLRPSEDHVWNADLAVEVPAVLVGGVLLWRRRPLGYVAGAGLLLQYGLTPIGLAASMALRSILTGSPLDVVTTIALLVFGAVSFVPLAFFVRGAARGQRSTSPPTAGPRGHPDE
jgi:hypothetical protein